MSKEIVKIFDTTLRDGEQSPGFSMNIDEKLRMAKQLAKLNVDIIEAGFPIASVGDFEAVKRIAQEIKGPVIAGLARANIKDIDRCWEAVQHAEKSRIHTFIATSDLHLKHKLKKTREQVLADIKIAVAHAANYTQDVEFSAEDATRSDRNFLAEVVELAIANGATTVNIPDTVGYTIPSEYFQLIQFLKQKVANIEQAIISVHCHNDLGLAVANSLAAIEAGARQVECTINGIGERAGNAAMEEIAMILKTRPDLVQCDTHLKTQYLAPTSKLLALITGIGVQPNKAIVGMNAFAHESGIHQDGMLKHHMTYEIMTPESVGWTQSNLVLGKHSGRHAFKNRLQELGYDLPEEQLNEAFIAFKALADKKKEIYDDDLMALLSEIDHHEKFQLMDMQVNTSIAKGATATITLSIDGVQKTKSATAAGPVEVTFQLIREMLNSQCELLKYQLGSITSGLDAQAEVTVAIRENNRQVRGVGTDTDVLVASAKAFINALNRLSLFSPELREGI